MKLRFVAFALLAFLVLTPTASAWIQTFNGQFDGASVPTTADYTSATTSCPGTSCIIENPGTLDGSAALHMQASGTAHGQWFDMSTSTGSGTITTANTFCSQGLSLDVDLKFTVLPSNGNYLRVGLTSNTIGNLFQSTPATEAYASFQGTATGAKTVYSITSGGATSTRTAPADNIVINTPYHFRLTWPQCTSTSTGVCFTASNYSPCFANPQSGTGVAPRLLFHVTGAGGTLVVNIDNVTISGFSTGPGIAASATGISVDAFDVDPTGNILIARTDSGANVKTWGAQSLGTAQGTDATGCGGFVTRRGGIMATHSQVGYLQCSGGTPSQLSIRSQSLGTADFSGSGCGNNDVCLGDIDFESAVLCSGDVVDRDIMQSIDQIDFAPINWSRAMANSAGFTAGSHAVAWTYGTTTGVVGVVEYTALDNGCDEYRNEGQHFGASPTQICSWTASGDQFIGAVEAFTPTQVFPYQGTIVDRTAPSNSGQFVLDGDLGSPQTYSGLSQGKGIACAKNFFLYESATELWLMDATNGTTVWGPVTVTGGAERGVAMDETGTYIAWLDGTKVHIGPRTGGGTFTCTIPVPSGNFRGVQLDTNGQNLWIGTDTQIDRYLAFSCTTITPVSNTGGLPGVTTTPVPGSASLNLSTGNFGTDLMLASMAILIMAGVGYYLMGLIGAPIGGVAGFLMSWGWSLLSTPAVWAIVVFIAFLVGIKWTSNRIGGG